VGGGGGVVARAFLNQTPRIGGGGPAPGGRLDESNSVGKKLVLKFEFKLSKVANFLFAFQKDLYHIF